MFEVRVTMESKDLERSGDAEVEDVFTMRAMKFDDVLTVQQKLLNVKQELLNAQAKGAGVDLTP